MKIQTLPESINDDVQDAMASIFEVIGFIQKDTIDAQDLLITKGFYDGALAIINSTDYLKSGDNPEIIKAIELEVESQAEDDEDKLMLAWISMKQNLEKADTQESFNARFALFVPVISKVMSAASKN